MAATPTYSADIEAELAEGVDPAAPVAFDAVPQLFGFSLNRIVAFLGPHLAWLAGVFATWLTTHVHFLALFHVGHDQLAKAISQALVFGVVTLVTWLGSQKWLEGYQKWAYQQAGTAALQQPAAVAPIDPATDALLGGHPEGVEYDSHAYDAELGPAPDEGGTTLALPSSSASPSSQQRGMPPGMDPNRPGH